MCSLTVISCKKEKDFPGDSDKVALDHFGMRVFFPNEGWKKEGTQYYENMPDPFKRECITAYLLETEEPGDTYTTHISFMRFLYEFESKEKANEVIEELHEIYESYLDSDSYTFVSERSASRVNTYVASIINCERKLNNSIYIEDMFFIYYNKNLYQIEILMPYNKKQQYYQDCLDIINTLKITE
jgi:hypothetical protein